jgi:hypothetical protein
VSRELESSDCARRHLMTRNRSLIQGRIKAIPINQQVALGGAGAHPEMMTVVSREGIGINARPLGSR